MTSAMQRRRPNDITTDVESTGIIALESSVSADDESKEIKRFNIHKKAGEHHSLVNGFSRLRNMNKIIIFLIALACMLPILKMLHLKQLSSNQINNIDIIDQMTEIQHDMQTSPHIKEEDDDDNTISNRNKRHQEDESENEEDEDDEKFEKDRKAIDDELPRVNPQILLSGMHHSGLSVVAKFISMMGIYIKNDLNNKSEKNGLTESTDLKAMVRLNKDTFFNGYLRDHGPEWAGYGFRWDRLKPEFQESFTKRAKRILYQLNKESNGKTWIAKDPRSSMLANHWLKDLKNPICILVVRDPIDTVKRLQGYNPSIHSQRSRYGVPNELPRYTETYLSEKEWGEVWEEYNVRYLEACMQKEAKIIIALHRELINDPIAFVDDLYNDLTAAGLRDIQKIPKQVLHGFVGTIHSFRNDLGDLSDKFSTSDMTGKSFLTPRAFKIWDALSRKDLSKINLSDLEEFSWYRKTVNDIENIKHIQHSGLTSLTEIPKKSEILKQEPRPDVKRKEAYFTIVSDNSKGYLSGALVLGGSIRDFDKNREMIAMITEEVTDPFVSEVLGKVGWKVVRVEKLPEAWYERHPKCNRFNPAQKVRWGRMFSKLQIWSFDYDQIAYADTDTMYLQSVDDYFSLPDEFYAERGVTHKGINCGIMVLKPSKEHLEKMLYLAEHEEPMLFFPGNMVGCTEQEVINRYFDCERMSRKLNNTRHADYMGKKFVDAPGRDDMRLFGARIVHWLTTKCKKPWDVPLQSLIVGHPSYQPQIVRNACDLETYRLWHQRFWRMQKELILYDMSKPDDLPMGLREEPTYEMLNTPFYKATQAPKKTNDNSVQFKGWGFHIGFGT